MLPGTQRLRDPLQLRAASLCMPALALILAAGLLTHNPRAALVATMGGLSVGFGAFQQFTRHRSAPMLLAALGMALSTGVGSGISGHETGLVLVSAVWAAGCAWLTAFGPGASWIVLQWSIALFVASAYPADLVGAAGRAGVMLLGGLLQLTVVSGLWRLSASLPPRRLGNVHAYLRLARRMLPAAHAALPYVIAAAVAVTLATLLEHSLDLSNGYWAPMTALVVIRPGIGPTWSRVLHRTSGTIIGAGLATLAAALLRPSELQTALLVLVFAYAAYVLRASYYALFTIAITGYVVLLLALGGLPEPMSALHRVLATALGAAISLLIVAVIETLTSLHTRLLLKPRRSVSR